jgi:hypothetical protein
MSIKSIFKDFISWLSGSNEVARPEPIPNPLPTIRIIVMLKDQVVGAIQSLSITEDKIENEYGKFSRISTKIYRIKLVEERIKKAFDRGFVNSHSQILPFNIIIDDSNGKTTIQNCWISKPIDYTYKYNEWIIIDEMNVEAELIKTELKEHDCSM